MTNMMRMPQVTRAQKNLFLDLLSERGVLVDGRVSYHDTDKGNFWKRVAARLNAVEGGVQKHPWMWCKLWSDWKNKTKRRADIALNRKTYDLQNPNPKLSQMDMRLLELIEYPMDSKSDVVRLQMNNAKAQQPVSEATHTEYIVDDFEIPIEEKRSSDDDHFEVTVKDEISQISDIDCESSDNETLSRKKRKSSRENLSIEDYKIKAQLALQKQKSLQKQEELRLRAVELKLKAEELRLKDIEISKVNYLTNLEEEKLKCLREISSSFKEFLERTRSTNNIGFHNV